VKEEEEDGAGGGGGGDKMGKVKKEETITSLTLILALPSDQLQVCNRGGSCPADAQLGTQTQLRTPFTLPYLSVYHVYLFRYVRLLRKKAS
jgi:hypothetical protein